MRMPHFAVYIPHHRDVELLFPLCSSLMEMERPAGSVRLVLVDNGSTDGSPAAAQRRFPGIEVRRTEENLGFAPALNRAVQSEDADLLIFLNNDVRVERDWLVRLFAAVQQIDSPCFASCLWDWQGERVQFAGGEINWFGKGFESTVLQGDEPYPIFFPCGGAMMIRRDVFLEMGGFDEEYFMIYEDVDLGWRLWLLGYSVYLVPQARVYHRGHASLSREAFAAKGICLERNSLATIYKNWDETRQAAMVPLALEEAMIRARALKHKAEGFGYSPDGFSTLQGIHSFFEKMDHWRQKREGVQRHRKITDEELIQRFFHDPERLWAYEEDHYRRLHPPQVKQALQDLARRASLCMRGAMA